MKSATPAWLRRLYNAHVCWCMALVQEVLAAAVDALKRMRDNRSARDEKMVVAMQQVADDTAQPECVTALPETHWEQLGRVSTTCLWYAGRCSVLLLHAHAVSHVGSSAMVREFQTEPRRDVVATAFEAATGCIQPYPPKSPQLTGKRRTSAAACNPWFAAAGGLTPRQRSALVGRLFRLGTPVNMEVLGRMGMRPSTNREGKLRKSTWRCPSMLTDACAEMTDFLRTSWRIPEVSHLRCAATQRGVVQSLT